MAPLQSATIFYLVNGRKLWYGWPVRDLLIITGILVVSLLAAGWIWRRRDLHL